MIKYAVCPGYIHSKNDGQRHFVSAQALLRLYGVDPRECITVDLSEGYENWGAFRQNADLIFLHPRFHGDYDLPHR